jgi:alkanesulfonate monooxygenase
MAGDGRWICRRLPERHPSASYLMQIARAAEQAGFDTVLVPCAFSSHTYGLQAPYADAYTMGVAALAATTKINVLIAHRPGFINPGVFAQMCASADDVGGGGRLALNIVTAGAPGDMEQFGDRLDHDDRYRRAEEFVEILRTLWCRNNVSFNGKHYRLADASINPRPKGPGGPPIYLVGASEAAIDMAARQADVYLMSAEPVERIASRIELLRHRAAAHGRTLRFGVAGTVFCRETDAASRAFARDFVEHADLELLAERQAAGAMTAAIEDLRARAGTHMHTWLTPTLWSGLAHLAYGAAWVGSYDSIARQLAEYVKVGVSVFQLYGYPFLEEAYNIGERLLPRVKQLTETVDIADEGRLRA